MVSGRARESRGQGLDPPRPAVAIHQPRVLRAHRHSDHLNAAHPRGGAARPAEGWTQRMGGGLRLGSRAPRRARSLHHGCAPGHGQSRRSGGSQEPAWRCLRAGSPSFVPPSGPTWPRRDDADADGLRRCSVGRRTWSRRSSSSISWRTCSKSISRSLRPGRHPAAGGARPLRCGKPLPGWTRAAPARGRPGCECSTSGRRPTATGGQRADLRPG